MSHRKQRNGPQRSNSEQDTRSTPYRRPAQKLPVPPPGDPEGRWDHAGHDLIAKGSTIYAPITANLGWIRGQAAAAQSARVNPSLRPFGNAVVPIPAPVQQSEQAPQRQAEPRELIDDEKPPANGLVTASLFERIAGLPPSTSNNRLANRVRNGDAINRPVSAPPGKRGNLASDETQKQRRGKNARDTTTASMQLSESKMHSDQMEIEMTTSKPEPIIPVGVTVRVKNLVDGTTADDVKTAFSSFGVILDCNMLKQGNGLQDALVTFTERSGAQEAVDKLDGALADNQTLRLSIVPPPKPKIAAAPPKAAPVKQQENSRNRQPAQQQTPDLLARLGLPNQSNSNGNNRQSQRTENAPARSNVIAQPKSQPPLVTSIPEIPSKMQADLVEQFDPRAYSQFSPSYPPGSVPVGEGQYIMHSSAPPPSAYASAHAPTSQPITSAPAPKPVSENIFTNRLKGNNNSKSRGTATQRPKLSSGNSLAARLGLPSSGMDLS